MIGIAITRLDLTAEDRRAVASRAPSIAAAGRILALALVVENHPHRALADLGE